MGGVAGTIPASFNQATMEIDYVRVYQNTLVDTQSPTNLTATVGAVTSSTVQLLLNANDNSGTVVYNISYNGVNLTFANPSGVQKSVIIPNLVSNTGYNFIVSATDIAGNANNTVLVSAQTTAVIGCSGSDIVATQGSFSLGYTYTFETLGSDVKITFQLLDTNRVGVVAFLWRQSPFSEVQMTNVTGNTFSRTITNQTLGTTINYAVKFAYQGGLSVTRYIPYVVGNGCEQLSVSASNNFDNFSFQNPVDDYLMINSEKNIYKVQIFNMIGALVVETTTDTKKVDVSDLSEGIYLLALYSDNKWIVKKMIVR
jgi:hypothetical protein